MNVLGLDVNANRVTANLVTHNLVVRTKRREGKNAKLVLLVGTSAAANVPRKFFVRTELFDGLRFSIGRIRRVARKLA